MQAHINAMAIPKPLMKVGIIRERENSMKRKILYALTAAVIAVTAFSIGKFTTTEPETVQPETIQTAPELMEMTVESSGLFLEYTDGTNFYSYWIPAEDLENAGLINTENIVDWNTDGQELAVMTKNDYEYYAYKSENIYQNRAFVPVESAEEK